MRRRWWSIKTWRIALYGRPIKMLPVDKRQHHVAFVSSSSKRPADKCTGLKRMVRACVTHQPRARAGKSCRVKPMPRAGSSQLPRHRQCGPQRSADSSFCWRGLPGAWSIEQRDLPPKKSPRHVITSRQIIVFQQWRGQRPVQQSQPKALPRFLLSAPSRWRRGAGPHT